VAAAEDTLPFPEMKFSAFSDFVATYLHQDISLAAVLGFLFTVLRNPDVLALHYRQKHCLARGDVVTATSKLSNWGTFLALAILQRWDGKPLNSEPSTFLPTIPGQDRYTDGDDQNKVVKCKQLTLAVERFVTFTPWVTITGKSFPRFDERDIQHIMVLAPNRPSCRTKNCGVALKRNSKNQDVPEITVITGTTVHPASYVLGAHCTVCSAIYYPDHSTHLIPGGDGAKQTYYPRSAAYMKIGRSLWVDELFGWSVLNGLYAFASTASFTEYWTKTYWPEGSLSRRHVWQAWVKLSVRVVSEAANREFVTKDRPSINEFVETANKTFLRDSIGSPHPLYGSSIPGTSGHSCSECTQPYPPAVDVERARPDQVAGDPRLQLTGTQYVRANVIDGIVMGPLHCAYDNCFKPLKDGSAGVFCAEHFLAFGNKCHVRGCSADLHGTTRACTNHQAEWKEHQERFARQSVIGMRRRIRQANTDPREWNPNQRTRPNAPAHDDDGEPILPARKNFFAPGRWYCLELMVAPCGMPVAFELFDKSESPTKIINFIEKHHPTPGTKSQYYIIDKACMVLRSLIRAGKWEEWKRTTRLIVDAYHYINHRVTDYVCRKWCNPAPMDMSAPNLVISTQDAQGRTVHRRAYNSQAAEQLNAWISGYQPILNRMTVANFLWYVLVLLLLHARSVEYRAARRNQQANMTDDEDGEEELDQPDADELEQ
ncbi:hypothetical protein AURDEDRAFT_77376, partial [Auricularia subglabra TFB-10046 SS5]